MILSFSLGKKKKIYKPIVVSDRFKRSKKEPAIMQKHRSLNAIFQTRKQITTLAEIQNVLTTVKVFHMKEYKQ